MRAVTTFAGCLAAPRRCPEPCPPSSATSLRIVDAGDDWHLPSCGKTSVRDRASADAASWSAGETVDALADARTDALGVRQSPSVSGLSVSPR